MTWKSKRSASVLQRTRTRTQAPGTRVCVLTHGHPAPAACHTRPVRGPARAACSRAHEPQRAGIRGVNAVRRRRWEERQRRADFVHPRAPHLCLAELRLQAPGQRHSDVRREGAAPQRRGRRRGAPSPAVELKSPSPVHLKLCSSTCAAGSVCCGSCWCCPALMPVVAATRARAARRRVIAPCSRAPAAVLLARSAARIENESAHGAAPAFRSARQSQAACHQQKWGTGRRAKRARARKKGALCSSPGLAHVTPPGVGHHVRISHITRRRPRLRRSTRPRASR